nr:ribonuclease H-like domain-containing protein [Tanacetum cinerariifolium]
MVIRAKTGIFKPLKRMNCRVTTTSPIPCSHVHALHDPNSKEAMLDEYNALITNRTWVLVPRPTNVNVVRSMWLFKHKFKADGSLSRYKVRLVVNERSQQQGIDCDETSSPVVKPATIRTILSLVPPGFVDSNKPDYVCHLQRSLYMLKQASCAWFQRFASYATGQIIASLHSEFAMTDLGSLNYFLESKLGSDGDPVSDLTLHRILAGALQYLTFTHLNLSYAVQHVCLYMHDPRDLHFIALKRILCYVSGTLDYGLQLHLSSTTQLSAYTDADWAGCLVTHRFTSGYCVFLDDNLLSWSVKR